MVPRPVGSVGRYIFVLFVLSKIVIFDDKLVIGLSGVQFYLVSLLVILKTNWIRVPLRFTLMQICYLKSLVMIPLPDRIGLHSVLLPLLTFTTTTTTVLLSKLVYLSLVIHEYMYGVKAGVYLK